MRPTFEKTVDILVKAYLNDTLAHDDCTKCAVGNLISAGGYKFNFSPSDVDDTQWLIFLDRHVRRKGNISRRPNDELALSQISATGYSPENLSDIESAFEKCEYGATDDEWMFNGLMAVVDVLAEIHGIDLKQREEAKLLFQKA